MGTKAARSILLKELGITMHNSLQSAVKAGKITHFGT